MNHSVRDGGNYSTETLVGLGAPAPDHQQIVGRIVAAGGPAVQASSPECYRLGCVVHLTHADAESVEAFEAEYQRSDKASSWPHSRLLTAGYEDSGRVKSLLVFIRPQ